MTLIGSLENPGRLSGTFVRGWHRDRVAIRQADGVVMKARDALSAIRFTDGWNSQGFDLVGNAGDVGLANYVTDEIHLAQDLHRAVLFVNAACQGEEVSAGSMRVSVWSNSVRY